MVQLLMTARREHLYATTPWAVIREQDEELRRLHAMCLRLAERILAAHEVLAKVAEKRSNQ